ncbi:MAG: N-acetylmuramoyl-L-alanine amidase [Oscillospiraceae bacterium]|nr:N-acetylmuramoyl-L-alanine amidase [Oscillospiraceae bacterium]
MSKKIVFDAGHGLTTGGKRTLNGSNGVVNEWTMNNNVCNYAKTILADYDVEVYRVDDVTGKTDVPLYERTNKINQIHPDLFVSMHHNANTGVWGIWGGVETYSHMNKRDEELAVRFAAEISKLTGLRNRGAKKENFHMIRETKSTVPSVLCEGGFMDSTTDYSVITSEKGQRAYAQAVANVCISYLGLKKKLT